MKRVLSLIFIMVIGLSIYIFRVPIVENIVNMVIQKETLEIPEDNEYKKEEDFLFLQNTKNFKPKTKEDIYNIFYTTINSGWPQFTFYCEADLYKDSINQVNILGDDAIALSQLNNYVHPFNSYQFIETTTDSLGKVTIKVTRAYTKDKQSILEDKVTDLIDKLITKDMDDRTKIKQIHNYIINNTQYDSTYSETGENNHDSNNAFGTLIQGYAVCGGYTDAMALFLSALEIKNYKISSATHIWNYVYVDNNWYHLDLTWDDPIINGSNEDTLQYDFFLITTKQLEKENTGQHSYDKDIYLEAK